MNTPHIPNHILSTFSLSEEEATDLYNNIFLPEEAAYEARADFPGWPTRSTLTTRFYDFLEYFLEACEPQNVEFLQHTW